MNNHVYTTEEALKHAGINTNITNHLPQQQSQYQNQQEIVPDQNAMRTDFSTVMTNTPLTGAQNNFIESSFPVVGTHGQINTAQTSFVGNNAPLMGVQTTFIGNNIPLVENQGLSRQLEGTYIPEGRPAGTTVGPIQYTTETQYINANPYLSESQSTNSSLGGTDITNAGLLLTNYTTPGIQHTHLAGTNTLEPTILNAGTNSVDQDQYKRTTEVTTTAGVPGNGTIVFRPIEGKFAKDKDIVGKMDIYCKFKIGWHSGKSSISKNEGAYPTWGDVISVDRKHNEEFAKLKVKDKDRMSLNDKIGEAKIPLNEIAAKGRVQQWFSVYKKDQLTGEILLDVEFQPRTTF